MLTGALRSFCGLEREWVNAFKWKMSKHDLDMTCIDILINEWW
jgi:hypothetical protein